MTLRADMVRELVVTRDVMDCWVNGGVWSRWCLWFYRSFMCVCIL